MKIVYVAHPIAGDVEGNIKKIAEIIRRDTTDEYQLIAPYLSDVLAFGEEDKDRRRKCMDRNEIYFRRYIVNELWVYGMSEGIMREILVASVSGIPIHIKGNWFNERTARTATKRKASKRVSRETRSNSVEAKR